MIYMNEKDFKNIADILEVSKQINELYEKLYNLEINNMKDSSEYYNLLNYLKTTINIENKLYNNTCVGANKAKSWFDYILNNKVPENLLSNFESIILQKYDYNEYRRMLNFLDKKYETEEKTTIQNLPIELSKMFDKLKKEFDDRIDISYVDLYSILYFELNKDIIKTYISILKIYINQEKNKNVKNKLIKSIYDIAFISKNLEQDIIENKFELFNPLYITSGFVSDINNISRHEYNIFKKNNIKDIANYQIAFLLNICDIDYNSINKYIESILRKALLRTCFTFLNENDLEDLNISFRDYIDSKNFLDKHPYDKISKSEIINCFKKINKDKEIPKILSFGIRK